eukprot:IDg15692t1
MRLVSKLSRPVRSLVAIMSLGFYVRFYRPAIIALFDT